MIEVSFGYNLAERGVSEQHLHLIFVHIKPGIHDIQEHAPELLGVRFKSTSLSLSFFPLWTWDKIETERYIYIYTYIHTYIHTCLYISSNQQQQQQQQQKSEKKT
jgi:hypothetical protein